MNAIIKEKWNYVGIFPLQPPLPFAVLALIYILAPTLGNTSPPQKKFLSGIAQKKGGGGPVRIFWTFFTMY